MDMKGSKQLYNKLLFIDTVILVCAISALVIYFFTSTKNRFLEQNLNYTEMMNESAASYLEEASDIAEYIHEDLYKSNMELKDVLHYMIEIIDLMHEEDSQYTPVVRQIMAEVQQNYKEDMNLKTLAYKYHMNASYLGQIFQKEVGCSFAQYLSKTKNGIAKDLILNTNMKINDIARQVGYPDTSYFYRKFKQCYGVSPASLREMKKY